jgi:hypothetical protein
MKMAKMDTLIMYLSLAAFVWLLYTYVQPKNTNYMSGSSLGQSSYSVPSPSAPLGQNEMYSKANGVQTNTYGLSSNSQQLDDPSQLLPNDANSKWSNLNPQGNGQLQNVNLLNAGFMTGLNTVGSTKRNKNLQDRSEYVIPQNNVGPWNQSTIEPDLMRKPLEIGQGPA